MRGIAALLVSTALCQAQYDTKAPLTAEVIRLARLRAVNSELFQRLPNFTCTLTIERSRRSNPSRRYNLSDNLRLEVALVNGKELYAWPGSKKFDDQELTKMVGGPIGDGDFALHARSILFSGRASLTFDGEIASGSRMLERWKVHQPAATSGFTLRIQPLEGLVGYTGMLYADALTKELVRIEMDVNEIPPHLLVKEMRKRISYRRTMIGDASYLLPDTSETTFFHFDASEARNLTSFSSCRQYTGESTLVFEDVEAEPAAKAPVVEWTLPPKLPIHLKATADIKTETLAVGDPVKWVVSKDAVSQGQVWLPAGAEVLTRVDAVKCASVPVNHCFLVLKTESFTFERKEGKLEAEMESPDLDSMLRMAGTMRRPILTGPAASIALAHDFIGVIFTRGGVWPKSATTIWRTLKGRGDTEP